MGPKAFVNGGWGVSAIFLTVSGWLSCIACLKLVDAGLALDIYSYPLVVEKILGKKMRLILEVAIALTQFSFAISYATFLIKSCQSTIDNIFNVDSNIMYYIVVVIILLTILTWVRNLAKFSFAFIFGNILILVTVIMISVFAIKLIQEQDGMGPDIEFIN